MTITRVGTNQKYADGWDQAFSKKKSASKSTAKMASPKKSGKKAKK